MEFVKICAKHESTFSTAGHISAATGFSAKITRRFIKKFTRPEKNTLDLKCLR